MKKAVLALITAALAAAPAAAAGRFTLTGGYVLGTSAMIGGGPRAGLSLQIDILRGLSFEIGTAYLQASTKDDPEGLRAGIVRLVPLEAGLRGRLALGPGFFVFLGAGAGITVPFSSVDADLAKAWTAVGFTLEEKVKTGFSASARCGCEALLTPQLGIVLEAGYRFYRAGGNWSISDDFGSDETSGTFSGLNLDSIVLGLGLSFSFGPGKGE
jgi:hypothetical protein